MIKVLKAAVETLARKVNKDTGAKDSWVLKAPRDLRSRRASNWVRLY